MNLICLLLNALFATHWCLNKCIDGYSDLEFCSSNGELLAPEILLNETLVHEGDWISVRCTDRAFLRVIKYFFCKDGHPVKSVPATRTSTAAYALHVSKESAGLYSCGYEQRDSNNQAKKSALSVPQKLLVLPRNPDPTNYATDIPGSQPSNHSSITIIAGVAGFAVLILASLIYFLTRKVVSRQKSSREEAPNKHRSKEDSEEQLQYAKIGFCKTLPPVSQKIEATTYASVAPLNRRGSNFAPAS